MNCLRCGEPLDSGGFCSLCLVTPMSEPWTPSGPWTGTGTTGTGTTGTETIYLLRADLTPAPSAQSRGWKLAALGGSLVLAGILAWPVVRRTLGGRR